MFWLFLDDLLLVKQVDEIAKRKEACPASNDAKCAASKVPQLQTFPTTPTDLQTIDNTLK
jgi:hypothetical protein